MDRDDSVRKRAHKGFTLIEFIATLVIVTVVGSLTYQIIGNMANIYAYITARNKLTSLIRQVDNRLVLEIRQAQAINTATPQLFECVIPENNTIRYQITEGRLQRQQNDGTAHILIPAENLNSTGSGFTYYDASMTEETNIDSIKSVSVILNLVSGNETYTLHQHILLESRRHY